MRRHRIHWYKGKPWKKGAGFGRPALRRHSRFLNQSSSSSSRWWGYSDIHSSECTHCIIQRRRPGAVTSKHSKSKKLYFGIWEIEENGIWIKWIRWYPTSTLHSRFIMNRLPVLCRQPWVYAVSSVHSE